MNKDQHDIAALQHLHEAAIRIDRVIQSIENDPDLGGTCGLTRAVKKGIRNAIAALDGGPYESPDFDWATTTAKSQQVIE